MYEGDASCRRHRGRPRRLRGGGGGGGTGGQGGALCKERRRLGSLILEAAEATAVPAGSALAVDRINFSHYIEEKLSREPGLEIIREEMSLLPQEMPVIIATG